MSFSAVSFSAVQACAVALLAGVVLQTREVSAGRGSVVDWREVRSGETLLLDADAFDVARLFVSLVGEECAVACLPSWARPVPKITAYMANERGHRRRSFEVGGFHVLVEPNHAFDDVAQADFTERLAALASRLL